MNAIDDSGYITIKDTSPICDMSVALYVSRRLEVARDMQAFKFRTGGKSLSGGMGVWARKSHGHGIC